ncbi:hypothetical protein FRC04_007537, partial [Tulasnella sp. 424]
DTEKDESEMDDKELKAEIVELGLQAEICGSSSGSGGLAEVRRQYNILGHLIAPRADHSKVTGLEYYIGIASSL